MVVYIVCFYLFRVVISYAMFIWLFGTLIYGTPHIIPFRSNPLTL